MWSAPITAGGGHQADHHGHDDRRRGHRRHRPRVLRPVRPRRARRVVDVLKTATGKTSTAAAVSSGATAASNAAGELALGFYADSGFGNTLAGDPGYSVRANVSPDQRHGAAGPGPRPVDRRHHRRPHDGHRREHDVAGRHHRLQDLGAGGAEPRPARPTASTASPGNGAGDGELDRARRRRQPDHAATRSRRTSAPPRRRRPSSPATRRRPTTTVTGPDQRHDLHVHGHRPPTRSAPSPPSVASNAGHAGATRRPASGRPLQNWPIVAVHSVLLKNGNLLHLGRLADTRADRRSGTRPRRPSRRRSTPRRSIFCSGNVHLPDGRILTVGGDGIFTTGNLGLVDTDDLRPGDADLDQRVADMHLPRWYPSLTELADGRYVAISGNSTNADDVGRHARGLRPGGQHLDAADRRLHAAGPRGGVPVLATWRRTARSSPSARRRTTRSSSTSPPRPGRRSAAPAAWSTARRSCTARARSSTAAARRASTADDAGARPTRRSIDLTAASPPAWRTVRR